MIGKESHISLSELAGIVDDLVKEVFYNQSFWIVAETSDVKNYADRGYCFVTLIEKEGRDTRAKMEAVIWSRFYHIIADFEIATGIAFDKNIKVLLKVSVDFSPIYGLKLQILDIDPSYTAGELEREKQAVLDRLLKQNPAVIHYVDGTYISQNKQLSRPLVFQRIALITAPDSDGRRDFLHELQSNPYKYSFRCDEYLCRIQGDGADVLIISQLQQIIKKINRYDVVVIVRGGGSQLDFGPFDTYELGLAIASCQIPVITGIGHERNVSIADLMSHLQVKTPTKAASFLVEHNHSFEEDVTQMSEYILSRADDILSDAKVSLDRFMDRLFSSAKLLLAHKNNELDKIGIALKHLDPENVIARGYAMVLKNNEIIVDPEKLLPGDEVQLRLKDYYYQTQIKSKHKKNEN